MRGFVVESSADFVAWTTRFVHGERDAARLLAQPIELAFDPPVAARYWRVRLARRSVLHLVEVELLRA